MATVTVSNENQLMAALNNAKSDTTILMAAGSYDNLYISGNKIPELSNNSDVTLKSLDSKNPATITNMILIGADNITFDGIDFDYSAASGASVSTRPFMILSSDNITVKNSNFDGDLAKGVSNIANGFGTGIALGVKDTSNLTVQNNTFSTFHKGVVVQTGTNINVTNNDVSGMASDGLNFQSVKNVLVADNYLHDFAAHLGTTAHKDMIQFWATGKNTPSSNVVIRDNILDSGAGTYTQSVLIKAENNKKHQDFQIENNLIYNAFTHGITLDDINGVVVKNNTVLQNTDSALNTSGLYLPKIHIGTQIENATVSDNVAHAITGNTWKGSGNLIVQNTDPNGTNYYGDLFVDALAGANASVADLAALPNSVIDQKGIGANVSLTGNNNLTIANSDGNNNNGSTQNAPASFSSTVSASSKVKQDDGDSGSGQTFVSSSSDIVVNNATSSGSEKSGGRVDKNDKATDSGATAISADFQKGFSDLSSKANAVSTKGGVKIVSDQGSKVAKLTDRSVITYKDTPDLFNNKAYTVMADFRKDHASDEGKLISFGYSFGIQVKKDSIAVSVTTNKGTKWINTKADVNDTEWHKVALTFDSGSGKAVVYLDGKAIGQVAGLKGATQVGNKSHDFHVGSKSGNSFDGLVDNVSFLTNDLSAAEIRSVHSGATNIDSFSIPSGSVFTSSSSSSSSTSNGSTSKDSNSDSSSSGSSSSSSSSSSSNSGSSSNASGSFSYTMTANNTKVVLDDNASKGIIDQAYLSGKTSSKFNVDVIQTKSTANFKNALGVYEIDKKGNIVDVRIIDKNTTDTNSTIKVTGVDKGNDLGFFIVQNGYNRLDKALGGNDLDLVVKKGDIYLANSSGILTKKVFVSHDKSLNYDNFQHVTSMDNPNSNGAIITFDDQHKGGRKDDMTDVVFEVTAIGADHLDFA